MDKFYINKTFHLYIVNNRGNLLSFDYHFTSFYIKTIDFTLKQLIDAKKEINGYNDF